MNQTSEDYAYRQESNGLAVLRWALGSITLFLFLLGFYYADTPAPSGEARTEETTGRQSVALTSPVTR